MEDNLLDKVAVHLQSRRIGHQPPDEIERFCDVLTLLADAYTKTAHRPALKTLHESIGVALSDCYVMPVEDFK